MLQQQHAGKNLESSDPDDGLVDDSTWTSQAYGDAFTDFTEQTHDLMITVYNALSCSLLHDCMQTE